MTYEETIENMAKAMYAEHINQRAGMTALWECHSDRYRESVRKEARAAAEAIGLREMMEALEAIIRDHTPEMDNEATQAVTGFHKNIAIRAFKAGAAS